MDSILFIYVFYQVCLYILRYLESKFRFKYILNWWTQGQDIPPSSCPVINSHLRLKFRFCDLNLKLIAIPRPKISNKSDLFFFFTSGSFYLYQVQFTKNSHQNGGLVKTTRLVSVRLIGVSNQKET